MKFNGRRQFGHRALTILRRIGLLIWCNQLCRIEHADLAESRGGDSRGFLSQTLSIFSRNVGIHVAATAVLSTASSSAEFLPYGQTIEMPRQSSSDVWSLMFLAHGLPFLDSRFFENEAGEIFLLLFIFAEGPVRAGIFLVDDVAFGLLGVLDHHGHE
jgi:hypothetical protein